MLKSDLEMPSEPHAVISKCETYRYILTRQVGPEDRVATFIMLNPSTADAVNDDQTIRKCIGFSKRWGCGKLVVLNLFAFRAIKPADMKSAIDPFGPDNKAWFDKHFSTVGVGVVVCAWGVHGSHRGQDAIVLGWFDKLGIRPHALAITKTGHPQHPLLPPYDVELVPFVGQT